MNINEIKSAVDTLSEHSGKTLNDDVPLQYCDSIWCLIDLATSVLNSEMPKEKDFMGNEYDSEYKFKDGYNQAIQEATIAHTRILLEKEGAMDDLLKLASKTNDKAVKLEQELTKLRGELEDARTTIKIHENNLEG